MNRTARAAAEPAEAPPAGPRRKSNPWLIYLVAPIMVLLAEAAVWHVRGDHLMAYVVLLGAAGVATTLGLATAAICWEIRRNAAAPRGVER